MISKYLYAVWAAIAPALGNHLWQSTLCLLAAGLMTWVLRRNHAQARYGLWLAASMKFLVPFSLLVAVGIHFARPNPILRPAPASGFYSVMDEVSQPFTKTAVRSKAIERSRRPWTAGLRQLVQGLPAILFAVWLCGFLAVLKVWGRRWRGMSAALQRATLLREGREVEALRRVERVGGIRRPIDLMLSPVSVEPGVFGIFKPVLVWPQGISERLSDEQLEAILIHEVWHVRRRDNLTAAIHMLVEAIFWFNPLVWWLGARLVEERERACDEAVLALGSERQAYAESILKTCEFCVEAPLACVSGVTGGELKQRIVRIMSQRLEKKLSFGRKILLAAIATAAVAGPVVFGLMKAPQASAQSTQAANAPPPSFEVASIKPNRSGTNMVQLFMKPGEFSARAETVKEVIKFAYDIKSDNQLSRGPGWIDSEKYDIDAKEEDSVAEKLQKLPFEEQDKQVRSMVRSLLAVRFKLEVSHETKDLPVYALLVAKNGPKLTETKVPPPAAGGASAPNKGFRGIRFTGPGELSGTNINIGLLADVLSEDAELGRLVIDQTGLKGNYDWTLKWTPAPGAPVFKGADGGQVPTDAPPPGSSGPSIFTAIQEQLGLKLESSKGPVELLVIDHIERPTEN